MPSSASSHSALAPVVAIMFLLLAVGEGRAILYGTVPITEGPLRIATIDPRTGYQRPLGKPLPGFIISEQHSCVHSYPRHSISVIGLNDTNPQHSAIFVIEVDLLTGEMTGYQALPLEKGGVVGVGQSIACHPSGSTLVSGLVADEHVLLSVAVNGFSRGTIKQVATIGLSKDVLFVTPATVDLQRNTWWTQVVNGGQIALVNVNLNTAQVSAPIPSDMMTVVYDEGTGTLVGLKYAHTKTTNFTVVAIQPTAPYTEATLAELPGYGISFAGVSAIDYIYRNFYAVLSRGQGTPFELVQLSLSSKTIVNHPVFSPGADCGTCTNSLDVYQTTTHPPLQQLEERS